MKKLFALIAVCSTTLLLGCSGGGCNGGYGYDSGYYNQPYSYDYGYNQPYSYGWSSGCTNCGYNQPVAWSQGCSTCGYNQPVAWTQGCSTCSANQPVAQDPNPTTCSANTCAQTNQPATANPGVFNQPAILNQPATPKAGGDEDINKNINTIVGSGWFSKGYENVSFGVNNGVVTLSGTVNSQDDKNKIQDAISRLGGVKQVVNQITVTPQAQ